MILPKPILTALGISSGARLDLEVNDGRVIVTPVKRKVREGWAEDAAAVAAPEEDPDEAAWMAFGNEGDEELTW